MAQRFPDFVIGGAPKCGTTSLYFWLAAHPQMCASKVKEPHFLVDAVLQENKNANFLQHGLAAYGQFFSHCPEDKIAFEATAQYLYHDTACAQLRDLPSQPKVVFLLREPSAQMYSHYLMMRYRTQNAVMPLQEYLKLPMVEDYVKYSQYLKKWLETWPEARIKVFLFEDLMKNKTQRLQEIATWLGINASFFADFDFEHRNETVVIKQKWMHTLGLKIQPLVPHFMQKMLLPLYLKVNSAGAPPKPDEEKEIVAQFKKKYANEAIKLKALLPELPTHLWY